jgi:hypothetical protein
MAEDEVKDRAAELVGQREWAQHSLESATTAYKRVRQMRGADAHKRSWHFKEQMDKAEERLKKIDEELATIKLESEGSE